MPKQKEPKSPQNPRFSQAAAVLVTREISKVISTNGLEELQEVLDEILPSFHKFTTHKMGLLRGKFDTLAMINKAIMLTEQLEVLNDVIKNPTLKSLKSLLGKLTAYVDEMQPLSSPAHKAVFSTYPEAVRVIKILHRTLSFDAIGQYQDFVTQHIPEAECDRKLAEAYYARAHKFLRGSGVVKLSDAERKAAFKISLQYREKAGDLDAESIKCQAETLLELCHYSDVREEKLEYLRNANALPTEAGMKSKVAINLFCAMLSSGSEEELMHIIQHDVSNVLVGQLMGLLVDYTFSLDAVKNIEAKLLEIDPQITEFVASNEGYEARAATGFLVSKYYSLRLDIYSCQMPNPVQCLIAYEALKELPSTDQTLMELAQNSILIAYKSVGDFKGGYQFIQSEKSILNSNLLSSKFLALDIYNRVGEVTKAQEIANLISSILHPYEEPKQESELDITASELVVTSEVVEEDEGGGAAAAVAEPAAPILPLSLPPRKKVKFTQIDVARIEASDPLEITHSEWSQYWVFKKKQATYSEAPQAEADIHEVNWKIGGENYIYGRDDMTIVHLGANLYASISKEFSLDPMTAKRFENALDHGFAGRALGVNGVKALDGVFELKIKGDIRLYTQKNYINPNGEYLVLFDKVGNHGDISRIIEKSRDIVEVQVGYASAAAPGDEPLADFDVFAVQPAEQEESLELLGDE